MKRYFDPTRLHFLFLVPLVAMALSDEGAMNAEDLRKEFVGNTVVSQLSEGRQPVGENHGKRRHPGL